MKPADANRQAQGAVFAAFAVLLWSAMPAVSQEPTDLKRIEKEIESKKARETVLDRESRSLAADLDELRRQSIKAARAAQASEAKLTEFEERITFLTKQQKAHEARLLAGQRHTAKTLSVLSRMARNPPQALLFSPDRPVEVVRRAMLLRAALPAIQRRAETCRDHRHACWEWYRTACKTRVHNSIFSVLLRFAFKKVKLSNNWS